jgi:ribosomal protein S25
LNCLQNAGVEGPVRGNRNRIQAGLRRRRGRAAANEGEGADGDGDAAADDNIADDVKAVRRKDAYEARRAAKDLERETQEAAQEEEIRKAAELRAQKEAEEAEKWMQTFTVEATGEDAVSKEEGEAKLMQVVEYLKTRKTVALEELAAEFGMRTGDAITKLQGLEEDGHITGIMDDRGKYIYISREEMERVAEFIRSNGRIAISELAAKSPSLIDLEGKTMPTKELGLETSPDLQELLLD